jgi:hypothetical protein
VDLTLPEGHDFLTRPVAGFISCPAGIILVVGILFFFINLKKKIIIFFDFILFV